MVVSPPWHCPHIVLHLRGALSAPSRPHPRRIRVESRWNSSNPTPPALTFSLPEGRLAGVVPRGCSATTGLVLELGAHAELGAGEAARVPAPRPPRQAAGQPEGGALLGGQDARHHLLVLLLAGQVEYAILCTDGKRIACRMIRRWFAASSATVPSSARGSVVMPEEEQLGSSSTMCVTRASFGSLGDTSRKSARRGWTQVARRCFMSRSCIQPPLVAVQGEDGAVVLHQCRQLRRLRAWRRARVHDVGAGRRR
ncbi:unnamed protein product [Prorocentrum cordatum]|uniref:Anaphase-promoting complex subunit 1 n=1 Tax=Prorocentrum cordatum TaxID=2364126 RepID=A0ABN9PS43_9DINO|nr:unnamed protein product [Polarella glacialis]